MESPDDLSDLLARVALKDRVAFRALYDRAAPKLFGVCLRILRRRAEAEEALQETFVKIWRGAAGYRSSRGAPMAWMTVVARNHAIDRLRGVRATTVDLDAVAEPADPAPSPEARVVSAGENERLSACLDELGQKQAAAVRACYLEGWTYQQAAERLDAPLNTVKTWIRRGLLALRACMERSE